MAARGYFFFLAGALAPLPAGLDADFAPAFAEEPGFDAGFDADPLAGALEDAFTGALAAGLAGAFAAGLAGALAAVLAGAALAAGAA
jgi:hypothetical protein